MVGAARLDWSARSVASGPGERAQFVGRAEPLAQLAGEFGLAAQGHPRIVWLEGDSGIGKTQLIRRFIDTAPPHRLVYVSGEEGESSLSFGVVDQLWARLGEPDRFAAWSSRATRGMMADPLLVGAELLGALFYEAEPQVLVVDDLQWIDVKSAAALLFLLRRLQAEPMLIVLVSQPNSTLRLRSGWARLLADSERVTHIVLSGLTPEELIELATAIGQGRLSRHQARRLHDHTCGHPLHSRSFLEEVGVGGLHASAGVLPAPRSLAVLVTAKVAALPGPAQDLLAAGAVLGRVFAPEVAAILGKVDDRVSAIEAAVTARLLDERVDRQVGFVHPLIHAAVYNGILPTRRRALHEAAAAVTSHLTSLNHRIAAAAGSDPGLAAELAALASQEAESGAYSRAADHLEAAARLADDPDVRERMLLEAVAMLHVAGDFMRAEAMRPIVENCRDGAQRKFVLGLIAFAGGRLAEAESLLARTVVASGGKDVPAVWGTRAASTLALARLLLGNWDGALAAADVATAGELAWERSIAQFAAVLSLAQLGRIEEARARLSNAMPEQGDGPGSLDVLAARGMVKLIDDDLAGAVHDLSDVARRARAGEPMRLHELALANLADAHFRLGDWDEALFIAELAVTLATDAAHSGVLVRAHTVAASVCACRGRDDTAVKHIEDADTAARRSGSYLGQALVAMAKATLADARGDPAGMLEALGELFDGRVDAALVAIGPPIWRLLVVEALVGAGPLEDAAAALRQFDDLVRSRRLLSYRADAARLAGLHAEARGDFAAAAAAYEHGLATVHPALSSTLAGSRLKAAYGRLLRNLGRRREAVAQLRAARDSFAKLDAAPYLARCDVELAQCGLPIPAGAGHDPLLLTAAETRVASLVADGLTNRDTASRLYISTKTVEYHLAHIFEKLGITSRHELRAAWAQRS